MISTIVGVFAVLFLAVLLFNVRAFKQLFGVGKAQAGKLARAAEGLDPVAMYQEKISEAMDNIRAAKDGLSRVKGLIASVERQVSDGKTEIARLDARIKLALHDNNESKAAEYAQQLQSARRNLEQNEHQLAAHKNSYQMFLKQVQVAQSKVITAKREAEKLGTELEISKVESEIGEINQRFSSTVDPLDEAKKFKTDIQRKIDQNRAKGQVSNDLNADLLQEEAEEQKLRDMEAKAILDQYKKDMQPQTSVN